MMCECEKESHLRRRRRAYAYWYQLRLPFPETIAIVPSNAKKKKKKGPSQTELDRQPSNFPPGWWSRAVSQGPDWRWHYQQEWIEKRKAADLPHVVKNPAPPPKKPCVATIPMPNEIAGRSVGTSAGNAVPGQLCEPRQMTAPRPAVPSKERRRRSA
jgi:hypothetical protein